MKTKKKKKKNERNFSSWYGVDSRTDQWTKEKYLSFSFFKKDKTFYVKR